MAGMIKGFFLLLVLLFAGLMLYAFVGPMLGADFSAPQQEIRQPVTLDVN